MVHLTFGQIADISITAVRDYLKFPVFTDRVLVRKVINSVVSVRPATRLFVSTVTFEFMRF